MSRKANIAVLVSGGGTNLQALIDAEKSGIIENGTIVLVISNKAGAYALQGGAALPGVQPQVAIGDPQRRLARRQGRVRGTGADKRNC